MANNLPAAQTVPVKKDNPIAVLHSDIEKQEKQFASVLPNHITPEKFVRVLKTMTNEYPQLVRADRRSLLNAAIKCAQDGLVPDGREAAITIFKTRVKDADGQEKWIEKAQYMPMVYGIHKKLRQSGEISSIRANVVYENDKFEYVLGDVESITHHPTMTNRGKAIAVYAIAVLKDGTIEREIMTHEEVEKIRAVSKSANGDPWTKWWSEMARKTVIRRLSKRLPMSAEVAESITKRDESFDYEGAPAMVDPEPQQIDQIEDRTAQIEKPKSEKKIKPAPEVAETKKQTVEQAKVIDVEPAGDTTGETESDGDDNPFDLTDEDEKEE